MGNIISDKLKSFTALFDNKTTNKKKINLILILGVVGIVLIGLSDCNFNSKETTESAKNDFISTDDYIENLENRVLRMIKEIDGAGKSKIMITAETSLEKNFATNDSIKQDSETKDSESSIKNDIEKEVVMVEDTSGKKQALIQNVSEPKIRGVLVLCEGAENPEINEKITNAIKSLLGVSSSKINVIKIK